MTHQVKPKDDLEQLLEPLFVLLRSGQTDQLPEVGDDPDLLPNELLLQFQDSVPTWWPPQRPQWNGSPARAWKDGEQRSVLVHQLRHHASSRPTDEQPLTPSELVNTLRHLAYGVTLEEPSILESS